MNNSERVKLIQEKLTSALKPTLLNIEDESAQHHGHVGAQSGAGHFAITIASPAFQNKSRVQCHQMIYDALKELMPHEIHALRIGIMEFKKAN